MNLEPAPFHKDWKVKINRVNQAGLTFGITICQKMRKSPAPSMFADSISEKGRDTMKLRIKNRPKVPATDGRIKAQ